MTDFTESWFFTSPTAFAHPEARKVILECIKDLEGVSPVKGARRLSEVRQKYTDRVEGLPAKIALECLATIFVLCDLLGQGWRIRSGQAGICLAVPINAESTEQRKAQVRAGHLVERDAQLGNPGIRRFVREMERPRLVAGQWRSIFSLVRDGRQLAADLARTLKIDPEARLTEVRNVINPYVQVVEPSVVCNLTGLSLSDIWRYFRHTWNTVYQSTPGREMRYLIRDAAAACHPVIGIGALGSSIVQLGVRDKWIGWTAESVIDRLREAPEVTDAKWIASAIQSLLKEIYVADFVKQRVLQRGDLARPTAAVIDRLANLAKRERSRHVLNPQRNQHKAATLASSPNWRDQAKSPLFKSKRALALAELLKVRLNLRDSGFRESERTGLATALATASGKSAVRVLLRRMKATAVGVKMMDITVCGAIAPYNALLGGKLVGLLSASPAIRQAYAKRYKNAESIIASSIAGRRIVRRPDLVLLGTTSLYDVSSSQYNRLRMPAAVAGGKEQEILAYYSLGRTVGYGSFHFSQATMELFELLLARRQNGRQVNSIFGEGVNPKLRKVRSALDALGLPSDPLLRHGNPRIVFAIPLASNFREILLGSHARPKMILPSKPSATQAMVDFWSRRWLLRRIEQPPVLESVAGHSLARPIQHGARVKLPAIPGEDGPLFHLEWAIAEEATPTTPAATPPGTAEARTVPSASEGDSPPFVARLH